jgi:RNA polymerase sigma-70 factor (ECF subfamily)
VIFPIQKTTNSLAEATALIEKIKLAKDGDQHAFRYLLEFFWNDVYGFMLQRTQNENEAEDLTIRSFGKAFEKIMTYDEAYGFKTWLTTIAKNLHIDEIRKKTNANFPTESSQIVAHKIPDNAPGPEDDLIRKQRLETLLNTIRNLKPHYREVIQLKYLQELSIKQITEKLNSSESTVKVKLMRARKLLSDILATQNS